MAGERASEGARNSQGRADGKSIVAVVVRGYRVKGMCCNCIRTRMTVLSERVLFSLREGLFLFGRS